jgi:hypothetical protein
MPQARVRSTKFRMIFSVIVVFIFAIPLAAVSQQREMKEQTVDVEDLFSFRLPQGWTKRSSFNVAEVRGEWAKGDTKLVYIWGKTESGDYGERRQAWMNGYEETTTRLRGRPANIRTFSRMKNGTRTYYAEMNVGNWEKGEVQLYIRIEGSDPTTIDLARQIFKSVTLPVPSPERPMPR